MPKYHAPQGFQFDASSGLFYQETPMTSTNGQPVRHITWFNADTGVYTQQSYPVPSPVQQPEPSQPAPVSKPRKTTPRKLVILGVAIGLCAALAGGVVLLRQPQTPDSYFPVGEFYRQDGLGTLTVEFGGTPELSRSFVLHTDSQNDLQTFRLEAEMTLDKTSKMPDGCRAMAVWTEKDSEEEGPFIDFYAISDGEIHISTDEGWAEQNPNSAPPDGVYLSTTGGQSKPEEKTPANKMPDIVLPPEPEQIVLKASGLYEVVEAGCMDHQIDAEHLYRQGNSFSYMSEDDAEKLSVVSAAMLMEQSLGLTGSADLNMVYDATEKMPFYLTFDAESIEGMSASTQSRQDEYISAYEAFSLITQWNLKSTPGYFGVVYLDETASKQISGNNASYTHSVSVDNDKKALHVSATMKRPPQSISEIEYGRETKYILTYRQLDMDISLYEDGSADIDGYARYEYQDANYYVIHFMLSTSSGKIDNTIIQPKPRKYVTFSNDAPVFGDKLSDEYTSEVVEREDGMFEVTWWPNRRFDLTEDELYILDTRAQGEELYKKMQELLENYRNGVMP